MHLMYESGERMTFPEALGGWLTDMLRTFVVTVMLKATVVIPEVAPWLFSARKSAQPRLMKAVFQTESRCFILIELV